MYLNTKKMFQTILAPILTMSSDSLAHNLNIIIVPQILEALLFGMLSVVSIGNNPELNLLN